MKNIHGGNIYDNKTDLDFSVNISPLGMPDKVRDVIVKSVDSINNYPDMEYCCIGSIGKKKDGEYNGDIDIAIKTNTMQIMVCCYHSWMMKL